MSAADMGAAGTGAAGTGAPPSVASEGPGLRPLVLVAFVVANLCAWSAVLTPAAITLALRVREIDPGGASATLSLVAAVGAACGIISNPLFGRLSDRTRSRFGMRRPWMLGGVVAGALGLLLVAAAESVPALVLGWAVTQLGVQSLLAAITAVLPDQVPQRLRGRIGGLVGMGQSAATTLGTGLLTLNSTSLTWGLLAPVCLAAVTVGFLCLVLPDRVNTDPRPPLSVREIASSFWSSPRRYPDFAWTWVSRLLVFMGITILIVYQTYFLLARIGVPPSSIAAVMFGVLLLENGVSIAANLVSGYLSDRAGRRKIFVAAAAVLGALGFAVAGLSQTLPAFLAGVALLGAAKGVYVAVDLAMATDLLPAGRAEAAKNMGLFNIASLFPNLLAPLIAPLVLGIGAGGAAIPGAPVGNYPLLFLTGGMFMLAGALAVRPIRGVR
jgi:MFS family permease